MNTLVQRVTIEKNHELKVEISLSISKVIEESADLGAVHLAEFGIYTHILDMHRTAQILIRV